MQGVEKHLQLALKPAKSSHQTPWPDRLCLDVAPSLHSLKVEFTVYNYTETQPCGQMRVLKRTQRFGARQEPHSASSGSLPKDQFLLTHIFDVTPKQATTCRTETRRRDVHVAPPARSAMPARRLFQTAGKCPRALRSPK